METLELGGYDGEFYLVETEHPYCMSLVWGITETIQWFPGKVIGLIKLNSLVYKLFLEIEKKATNEALVAFAQKNFKNIEVTEEDLNLNAVARDFAYDYTATYLRSLQTKLDKFIKNELEV